jgi:hypothetical protein
MFRHYSPRGSMTCGNYKNGGSNVEDTHGLCSTILAARITACTAAQSQSLGLHNHQYQQEHEQTNTVEISVLRSTMTLVT